MGYINFSITNTFAGGRNGVFPRSERISVGFSREGGRVENVDRDVYGPNLAPPRHESLRLSPAVRAAADGVLDAILAGNPVQNIEVVHGDGAQPAVVNWTMHNRDAGSGTALMGNLPAGIQQVLAAASVLEAAIQAQTQYVAPSR